MHPLVRGALGEGRGMRIVFLICSCLLLSGCGTPISSFANMALSSVTYFFTGKTTTDHGLSFMLQEDCEILRALEGDICRPIGNGYPKANLEVALQPLKGGPELAGARFLRADGSVVVDPNRPMLAETPLAEDLDGEGLELVEGVPAPGRDPRAIQTATSLTDLLPAGAADEGADWDRRFGFYRDR